MNNQQKDVSQSTCQMAQKPYKNRFWFMLFVFGGILLTLLVSYYWNWLGLGGIGTVGLWISARVIANYSDTKTKWMTKEER
jgi:hypothetical protein